MRASLLALVLLSSCVTLPVPLPGPTQQPPQRPRRGPVQAPAPSSAQGPVGALATRGHAATFDVGTWNIEQFGDPGSPPADGPQIRNAATVLAQSGIDLWAIQEVTSEAGWRALLDRVEPAGYVGVLGPEPTFGNYKAGFLYDPRVVTSLGVRQPLPITGSYGGKQPLELHAEVTVGGETARVRVVAFHAKNGNAENDHYNRSQGALKLKAYADDSAARGEAVILLGDFNDFLTRATYRNAERSPYAPFLDSPGYAAATLALEQAGVPTSCRNRLPRCGSGPTIDHIVYTETFPGRLVEVARYEEAVAQIEDFAATTSDHAPVFARFELGAQ